MQMNTRLIVIKAVIYRIIGVANCILISYFFTQNITQSIYISLVGECLQFFAYIIYEICWNKMMLKNKGISLLTDDEH